MDKKEAAMIGFEIVAYAGEARSNLLQALKEAKRGEFENVDELIEKANESILKAHKAQTEMLAKEAGGEDVELGFIMVHGQDHLMTTMLLKDIIENLLDIYKEK